MSDKITRFEFSVTIQVTAPSESGLTEGEARNAAKAFVKAKNASGTMVNGREINFFMD
jgi:hypothetical protein